MSASWMPLGQPLHRAHECRRTGCVHCSRCGLGPQISLTYFYASHTTNPPSTSRVIENGLCPQCASQR